MIIIVCRSFLMIWEDSPVSTQVTNTPEKTLICIKTQSQPRANLTSDPIWEIIQRKPEKKCLGRQGVDLVGKEDKKHVTGMTRKKKILKTGALFK